jgi:hypothetical protein
MNRIMKHAIIKEQLPTYLKLSKKAKGAVLQNIMSVTGMPSKSVIRALRRERNRSSHNPPPRRRGRKRYYIAETDAALAFIWEQYDYPTAERLHPEIREAVRIFLRDGMWSYDEMATQQLLDMSLGSMKVRTVNFAKKERSTTGNRYHPIWGAAQKCPGILR